MKVRRPSEIQNKRDVIVVIYKLRSFVGGIRYCLDMCLLYVSWAFRFVQKIHVQGIYRIYDMMILKILFDMKFNILQIDHVLKW